MKQVYIAWFVLLLVSLACTATAGATPTPVPPTAGMIESSPVPANEEGATFVNPEDSTPAPSLEAPDQSKNIQRDITYCTLDGVQLKMDLYFPKNAGGKTALTVFIHGGGWSKGDKADRQGQFEIPSMVKAGFTVASLNYRLAPAYQFPAMIEDVKCAIRSLRAHADEYNIDPNRIGVWGTSAGSHLATLIGLTDANAGFERGEYLDQSSRVQVVVDMFGPADLTTDFSKAFIDLKDTVFADFDGVLASPITHISADDPPFLILHGDRDPVVPLSQSQLLYDAMITAGLDVEMTVVVNGNHGFTKPGSTPTREEITAIIVQFFLEHLR